MSTAETWVDIGPVEQLERAPLTRVMAGSTPIALSFIDGQFGAVSNACNHVGGPLGDGRLTGDYVTCPWHGWKFHRLTGVGEPGYEGDCVPAYRVKVENGRVLVDTASASRRTRRIPLRASRNARPARCVSRRSRPR
jgi:nitrite reductase/ring-hydroxylating ferredoxin subunit